MIPYTFGPRANACHDCWECNGAWYCTMNCGPRVLTSAELIAEGRKHAGSVRVPGGRDGHIAKRKE
jgi:hypothetical protein